MIEVRNLTRKYGPSVAVDAISFTMKTGEVLGFLGPNGAGKTTTMKVITGYMPPSEGDVLIDGVDVTEDSVEVRRKIGYLPENNPLYTDMTPLEYLTFCQRLRGIPRSEHRPRNDRMVAMCGLEEVLRKDIGELSKGYRQRVGLAQAMVHDPEILILDEPTVGLDPNQIVEIRALIKELGRAKTLILCTHILSEVEAACDRVLIISKGKIVADGTPDTLRAAASGHDRIHVEVRGPAHEVLDALKGLDGAARVSTDGQSAGASRFVIETAPAADLRESVFKLVRERGWVLLELRRESVRLEDVFRQLTTQS
ncbi:MAG TPA: ATP-binding cassette domain-containing protein [candidate division Zixibacteria bacterium]|jgi:ABC-2 type transport system ATP-binding protein